MGPNSTHSNPENEYSYDKHVFKVKPVYRKDDWLQNDMIQWKHIPCNRPFVGGIHRSVVDSSLKSTEIRTFDVPLLLLWSNCLTNAPFTGNSRRHDGHVTAQ